MAAYALLGDKSTFQIRGTPSLASRKVVCAPRHEANKTCDHSTTFTGNKAVSWQHLSSAAVIVCYVLAQWLKNVSIIDVMDVVPNLLADSKAKSANERSSLADSCTVALFGCAKLPAGVGAHSALTARARAGGASRSCSVWSMLTGVDAHSHSVSDDRRR